MRTYTFMEFRTPETMPGFVIEQFSNQAEATGYARNLLQRDGYAAIEIWDGATKVRVTSADQLATPE